MKIRSRWLNKLFSRLMVYGFHLLFATCRKVHLAPTPQLSLQNSEIRPDDEMYVLCVWHDLLVIPTFSASRVQRHRTCCLVSRHQDGGYLADAMSLLGYSTVRGSSSRGGAQAVKQLVDDTAGKHIVFTPDGPRGPRRELKPGAVYVASQTGRSICPSAYACRRGWRIQGSWTDMLIPKPFTTVYLLMGQPIAIPSELSREQLHTYVELVQTEMDRLNAEVTRLAAGDSSPSVTEPAPATAPRNAA